MIFSKFNSPHVISKKQLSKRMLTISYDYKELWRNLKYLDYKDCTMKILRQNGLITLAERFGKHGWLINAFFRLRKIPKTYWKISHMFNTLQHIFKFKHFLKHLTLHPPHPGKTPKSLIRNAIIIVL